MFSWFRKKDRPADEGDAGLAPKRLDEGTKNDTLQLNRMASSTDWRDIVTQNTGSNNYYGAVGNYTVGTTSAIPTVSGWQQVQLNPGVLNPHAGTGAYYIQPGQIITTGGAMSGTYNYQAAGIIGYDVTIEPSPMLPKLEFTEEEIEKAMEIING